MKKNLLFFQRTKQAVILFCGVVISGSQSVQASASFALHAAQPFSISAVNQQLGAVTGKITDKDGLPLVGASVKVIGTSQVTATDSNGDFKFQLAPGTYTFEASYISFKTQQKAGVVVNENLNTNLSIILEDGLGELSEVVVVGYGQNVRRNLTTAIGSVKPSDIADRNVASANQLLQGQVAGVNLTSSNGTPGGNSRVSIRG